jgi:hypothetical protein
MAIAGLQSEVSSELGEIQDPDIADDMFGSRKMQRQGYEDSASDGKSVFSLSLNLGLGWRLMLSFLFLE